MTLLNLTISGLLLVIVALVITIFLQRKRSKDETAKSISIRENLESSIESLNEEFEQLKAKYRDLIDLDNEKSSLASEIDRLQISRGEMVEELKKLAEGHAHRKAEFDGLNIETEKLEESIKHSSIIREDLTKSIEALNAELERLNEERAYVSKLVEEKSSLASEIDRLQISRGEMVEELKKLAEGHAHRKAEFDGLNIETEKLEESIKHSSIIREDLTKSIEALNAELERLNEERAYVSKLVEEKSSLASEIDRLQISRDEMTIENNSNLQKLNDEYTSAKKIFEALNLEIQKLEESLEISSFGLYKPHYNYDTPETYKIELDKVVELSKEAIKADRAINCGTEWRVEGSVVQGRKMTRHYSKTMLRAFNGECDAAVLKVRWNNITNMEERILRAYAAINKLGESLNIGITDDYLQLKMQELRLTYEYEEKLHEEKEEQRRIREQLREEEKSIREIEKARIEAEKEEARYAKALRKAREELSDAKEEEVDNLKKKINELEIHLKDAQELKERAISMAQITKAGHVYVISNIGSFGENVYKIGMTRRMEPADRVRELSGASVPFGFDIHALIYSENAPELENKFHKKFTYNRLNLINNRKEFFSVTLKELEDFAHENGYTIEFTKIAEARDYRQTCSIRNIKSKEEIEAAMGQIFPDSLLDIEDEEEQPA